MRCRIRADEEIVGERAEHAAGERSHDWHPPPIPSWSAARNTFLPHPPTAVNSRGPRSRAGLIAYPQLKPKVIPISTTSAPTQIGARFVGAPIFSGVGDPENAGDEQRGPDDLIDQSTRQRAQMGSRIGGEDSRCRRRLPKPGVVRTPKSKADNAST